MGRDLTLSLDAILDGQHLRPRGHRLALEEAAIRIQSKPNEVIDVDAAWGAALSGEGGPEALSRGKVVRFELSLEELQQTDTEPEESLRPFQEINIHLRQREEEMKGGRVK
jgi:hypothetical protein